MKPFRELIIQAKIIFIFWLLLSLKGSFLPGCDTCCAFPDCITLLEFWGILIHSKDLLISKFNGAVCGDNHQKSGVVHFKQTENSFVFYSLTGLVRT